MMTIEDREPDEPHVDIFWLFENKLIIDSTPLSSAALYGDCCTQDGGHIDVWAALQDHGAVPLLVEYEVSLRGRIVYDKRHERFVLYADRCILKRKRAIKKIMAAMNLPSEKTDTMTDAHYRCSGCLYGKG
jgi:hypothetical protein